MGIGSWLALFITSGPRYAGHYNVSDGETQAQHAVALPCLDDHSPVLSLR